MQRSHVCFWRETDLWFRARCLEFDLLREPKRIVYFHPEVAHRSFNLGVAQQQLDRS